MNLSKKVKELHESDNIMKACKGLCSDSTEEEIEAAAKKSGYDVKAIKKVLASKKKMSEGLSMFELEKIMKKAHVAEILDMMSDYEGLNPKISAMLSKYSEQVAKIK